MSCNSGSNSGQNNGAPVTKQESCSGGFFGNFFGGKKSATEMCGGGCGEEKCNCNCALKDHLKDCCGFGQLPKRVECPKNPPASSQSCSPAPTQCASAASQCAPRPPPMAPGNNNCGCGPAAPSTPPAQVCQPKPNGPCARTSTGSRECPPMPCTDVSGCVPEWLCNQPSSNTKKYPAPPGAVILPISAGGRNSSSKQGGSCGAGSGASPKVANKDCPAVRPRCPSKVEKEEPAASGGFFSKITSIFGGSKK